MANKRLPRWVTVVMMFFSIVAFFITGLMTVFYLDYRPGAQVEIWKVVKVGGCNDDYCVFNMSNNREVVTAKTYTPVMEKQTVYRECWYEDETRMCFKNPVTELSGQWEHAPIYPKRNRDPSFFKDYFGLK